jgi:putative ABC transport system permease protein
MSHLRSARSESELRRPAPPYLAERLLRLALRSEVEREMVLGDLHEQLPRHGTVWYWRQAAAIAAHAMLRRAPSGDPRPSGDFFMRIFFKDVKYAWRSLFKRPLLTATVAITLALGLGANAAIFNLVDRMVLRPFPAFEPDHVVMIAATGPRLNYRKETVSAPDFFDWRDGSGTITHLSAMTWWDANLAERDDPERLQGTQVTASFFDALGIRPALGRGFVRDDETFGRHRVVVLSDALWKRRFDGDRAIVGRGITVDGEIYQVVGVAPPRFMFPDGAELWAPIAFDPVRPPKRDGRSLTVIGRLQNGKTLEDAQGEMALLAGRLAREYPETNRDYGARVYTLTQGMLDEGSGPILSLWQASAFVVLLIACANIANLMLARAAERRRETAVRLALGASRGRVVRELLTESALLALIAVPPAIGFAWICLYFMRISMPARILKFVPGFETLGPDLRLLGFTVVLALLTACIFGVLPAFQAARSRVSESLKEGGRTATGRQLLRRGIVVAEMAIALPLLVAAGLGVIGTHRFLGGPQGYDPDGLLTIETGPAHPHVSGRSSAAPVRRPRDRGAGRDSWGRACGRGQ